MSLCFFCCHDSSFVIQRVMNRYTLDYSLQVMLLPTKPTEPVNQFSQSSHYCKNDFYQLCPQIWSGLWKWPFEILPDPPFLSVRRRHLISCSHGHLVSSNILFPKRAHTFYFLLLKPDCREVTSCPVQTGEMTCVTLVTHGGFIAKVKQYMTFYVGTYSGKCNSWEISGEDFEHAAVCCSSTLTLHRDPFRRTVCTFFLWCTVL